jgi:hypothetical protein
MDTPLIIDEKEPKWVLLSKILDIITSRRVKQEMAKQGITPVNLAGAMVKIVLIAMFFSVDITYVVSELQKRRELMSFAKLGEIPEAKEIYRFLGRLGLVKSLREKIENWKNYKPIRGTIEDIFKLAKNSFSLKKFHRYTKRSVKKSVCLHVLLVGIVISLGINSKKKLQKIAEW